MMNFELAPKFIIHRSSFIIIQHFHRPRFRFLRKKRFGFCPGIAKKFGMAIYIQRRFRIPDAERAQDVRLFRVAQQFHVPATREGADTGFAGLEYVVQENGDAFGAEGHFDNAFNHV